jgi:NAD dependent epimerase/dehydratase family enzyme
MPTPAWLLRLMLGEMSTLLLHSTHATPQKLLQAGFTFAHPTLPAAIRHELSL